MFQCCFDYKVNGLLNEIHLWKHGVSILNGMWREKLFVAVELHVYMYTCTEVHVYAESLLCGVFSFNGVGT